ncbi:MAG TPA: ADOP family duplicated permease [Bryobacteraceae bacterium]
MPARIDVLLRELAVTLRGLRRDRTFTLVSVALLALGIGLTSAVVSLLWRIAYAQLPIPDPSHLYTLNTRVGTPTYRYLAAHLGAGPKLIARHDERVNIETAEGSRHLDADFVSGNYFGALGVRPVLGRAVEPSDDSRSGRQFVAVLAYGFWQQAFGGQISALGAPVRINGVPFRVIGIAPPHFTGLIAARNPQLYLPVAAFPALNPGWDAFNKWSVHWLDIFVRTPPNLPVASAEAQWAPVYRDAVRQELANEGPQSQQYLRKLRHEKLSLTPAQQGVHWMLSGWKNPLRVLLWMALSVLLLVTINVAGLAVVRSVKQRHEMLIRYAVGASRAAVVRLYFAQTMALALLAGLAAILVARWGAKALVYLGGLHLHGTALPVGLGASALGLHWAAAIIAGLLAGMLPAWHAARMSLAGGLSEGATTHSASRSHTRSRRILAAAQIALSLVLLIAAGLFAQALYKLVSVPLGFNPRHLMLFSVDPKISGATAQSATTLFQRIDQRVRSTPGVANVSYGTSGPFPQAVNTAVVIPTTPDAKSKHQRGFRSFIGPGYFRTLGIPMAAGREFNQRDRANTPGVVIIDQTMAKKLYGDANPIGKTVTIGVTPKRLATIVGVVADYNISWTRAHSPLLYTPVSQASGLQEMTFYVRTAPNVQLSARDIRELIQHEAPETPAFDIGSMGASTAGFASGQRAMALLTGAFAGLALLIALVGIYGVIAYSASLRTVEFGVRVAVGAEPRHIRALILREAGWILLGGLILAVPLAFFGLQTIRTQMFAVSIDRIGVYIAATALVIGCTLLAALIPARRATRMNVQAALRHE